MSFQVEIDQNAAAAAEEAANRTGGGVYPPLPRGRYQAVIKENKGVEGFGGSGANSGKKVVRLRVDILEQSPTGATRVFFFRVPLFSRFAPTEKNPDGASAWLFWSFFEKVMGVPREDILAGKPLPSNVEGRRLTIILGKAQKPDEYNPLGFNDIDDVDAPDADFAKTPLRVAGVSVAPWLTPADELIPDHPSLAPKVLGGVGGVAGPGLAPVTPIGGGYAPMGVIPGGIPPQGQQLIPGQFPQAIPQTAPQTQVAQAPIATGGPLQQLAQQAVGY